jgi:hypothetical protein
MTGYLLGTNSQSFKGVKPLEILNFAHSDYDLKGSFERPPLS